MICRKISHPALMLLYKKHILIYVLLELEHANWGKGTDRITIEIDNINITSIISIYIYMTNKMHQVVIA